MKNLLIFLSLVLAAGAIILSVNYYGRADKAQSVLNEERYLRMTAEEGQTKAEAKVSSLQSELDRTQKKLQAMQKMADQERSKDLKAQRQRIFQSLNGSTSQSPSSKLPLLP